MAEDDSLSRLQGLQADLVAFSESRLPNLDRLWAELEESIDDFKRLLDKEKRSEKSRQALAAEHIKVGETEYGINEDFRQEVIQVADALDLDEIEAAELYIECQESAQELDRPPALTSVLRFHGHRESLLAALRLSVQQASDLDIDSDHREVFVQLTRLVAQGGSGAGASFWRKCLSGMEDVEQWIKRIDERLQTASVIGQSVMGYALEALQYQRGSLQRQHESLGAILCHLVKEAHATIDDYRLLLTKMAALQNLDDLVLHYVPVLLSCASCFGPSDGAASFREARSLDQTFADNTERTRWRIPDFRAAATAWWLAEYNGRYTDNPSGSPLQGVDLERESDSRSSRFMEALTDGAFQFMLLVCSKVRPEQWHDPAKAGLIVFLLGDTNASQDGPFSASDFFQDLLAQHMQLFVDALITNMPDTIRRLKFEEDEQRRNMGLALPQVPRETTLHLERFLAIISYAFAGFPEAAHEAFWSDPDGNMYGFLQWASKRQSTPRVAAFCEMFQSISENTECADSAHKFLMDEAIAASSARLRKGASLSWTQVFAELGYYASRLQETPGLLSSHAESGTTNLINEPESSLMLECYLRLAAHMCRASPAARDFILSNTTFQLHEVLFELVKSGLDSRFKACAFQTMTSMLTNKQVEVNSGMWEALDGWLFGIQAAKSGAAKPVAFQGSSDQAIKARLRSIASGFEEPNGFVNFIQALVAPVAVGDVLDDTLPFPEQLGQAYRMPGIDHYVDFVLNDIFKDLMIEIQDKDHIWELRCSCLTFISTCLSTFNEDLVVFANSTSINVDGAIATSSLAAYVRLHPFARVMEWLFNDGIIAALFAAAREDPEVIGTSSPESPRILALCRSIEVISLLLKLQSTYFDIVRPIVKTQSAVRNRLVANPALASFEDAILGNMRIVADLGLYCGTGHLELTILSLDLLQKLAISRKLSNATSVSTGTRGAATRVLTALQQDNDVDRIAAAFIAPLQIDPRELEMGESAPGFTIKQAILDLINRSLDTVPNKPALAHCLLGLTCGARTVSVRPDGRFSNGSSLFHSIARLLAETLCIDESNSLPWLSSIRRSASEIMRKLVKAPLTSHIILDQLRESGFNEAIAIGQRTISGNTTWLEKTCDDPDFLLTESSAMFRNFLDERTAYFENGSLQLRSATQHNAPSIRERAVSSLLGSTTFPSGAQVQNVSIFDMFDFVDLEIATPFEIPATKYMAGLDFTVCRTIEAGGTAAYDLRLVKELLSLREAELRKDGQLADVANAQQCHSEADTVLLCVQADNQNTAILTAQRLALKAYVQLITIILGTAQFEPAQKLAFILQALQIVLPKLDLNILQESTMTLPLMKLVYALLQAQGSDLATRSSREANVTNERLLHAFRSSLRGIASAVDSVELRESCYQIARHFLKHAAADKSGSDSLCRHANKMVESAGERLVDIICEDALSSQGSCRVAALLMLEACVQVFHTAKASHMVRSMTRLNFIAVLVDSIRGITSEFQQEKTGQDLTILLTSIHSGLVLLLRLSQDNGGATAILDAGIFGALRDSQLFSTDPDIGLDIENPAALESFYKLLVASLRIINSIIITKGSRNSQIAAQGRNFLLENRACMQAIFKGATRGDRLPEKTRQCLDDLVDNFTVLIAATDFIESDDKPVGRRSTNHIFT